MIATLIREGRMAKGYTQKELSELSNISVRSIQRIENAEILPRSYTLKTLSGVLGISFESIQQDEPASKPGFKVNRGQKIILTITLPLLILLLGWAFIAQSAKFPETTFELLLFIVIAVLVTSTVLVIIWRS